MAEVTPFYGTGTTNLRWSYSIIFQKKIEHFYTQSLEKSINNLIDRGWRTD